MHDDLATAIQRIEATRDAFLALASPLPEAEFNWRRDDGSWSIGQCIDHVATTAERMIPLLEAAIADARARGKTGRGPFGYGAVARWFLKATGPTGGKAKAPAPYRPSRSTLGREATLERLRGGSARLVEACRSADGIDLRRVRVPSAALALLRLPLGIWFLSLAGHGERHLAQAIRVREDQGFGALV